MEHSGSSERVVDALDLLRVVETALSSEAKLSSREIQNGLRVAVTHARALLEESLTGSIAIPAPASATRVAPNTNIRSEATPGSSLAGRVQAAPTGSRRVRELSGNPPVTVHAPSVSQSSQPMPTFQAAGKV